MRTFDELMERVGPYKTLYRIFDEDVGYIVWRLGTGDNIEVLFIEAKEPGKGYGKELFRRMVRSIESNKRQPYHSVYVYRLGANELARRLYAKLGCKEINLGQSVYRDDETVIAWITWEDLKRAVGE